MSRLRNVLWAAALLLFSPHSFFAQSIYNVSIDTTPLRGRSGRLVFEMTSNFPLTNRVDLINFTTDGTTYLPQTQGGLISGDLIMNTNAARFTRLKANGFFTELVLPFAAFGYSVNFAINLSETAPRDGRPPDRFSFFLLEQTGLQEPRLPRVLRDRLSRLRDRLPLEGPLLSVTITGERGGKLDMQRVYRGLRDPAVTVTPAWTPDDPVRFRDARTLVGTLLEFCNRRCAGEIQCTGGAFALVGDDDVFYRFDDVSNLKAQVALVEKGQNPLATGQFGRARVVAVMTGSVLTVLEIEVF